MITTPADDELAWVQHPAVEYDRLWRRFETLYNFRASTRVEGWPAINEPRASLTFDLSVIEDGPRRAAAYDAINAEALRSFVWALGDVPELVVLDWQHPAYRFRPVTHALMPESEWNVPVYPDGDYYAFLTPELTEGTFGHPWEQSLCVIGERLCASLGASLGTWLPLLRRAGQPVTSP